ncbi:geranylgeranyl pyrophosphate synthase [Acrasis kona]|uniref:Geranylgeranyl pyrophosphate synthase n=1 Tax=Acrasis kona TaxID=1008807 RepID=A0AAW2ZB47_9EUKA
MSGEPNPFDDPFFSSPTQQNKVPEVRQYQNQYSVQQPKTLNVDHINDTAVMDNFLEAFERPQPKVPVQHYQNSPSYNPPKEQHKVQVQQYEDSYSERGNARVDDYQKQAQYKPAPTQKRTEIDYDDDLNDYKQTQTKKKTTNNDPIMYRMVHTNTHGSTRQVTVYDKNGRDEDDHAYRAHICLDPLKIKIQAGQDVIEIKQKLLSLHPTFVVKRNGTKFGTCTQRFKVNSKKFNYERADNQQILKMVGEYGHHFAVNLNGELIAKVVDVKSELTVEIDSPRNEIHIVCLCMIMLQQRFLGVMGGGKPSEFERK